MTVKVNSEFIKEIAKKRGMSLPQISRRLGYSDGYIGKRVLKGNMSEKLAMDIACVLRVNEQKILMREQEKDKDVFASFDELETALGNAGYSLESASIAVGKCKSYLSNYKYRCKYNKDKSMIPRNTMNAILELIGDPKPKQNDVLDDRAQMLYDVVYRAVSDAIAKAFE